MADDHDDDAPENDTPKGDIPQTAPRRANRKLGHKQSAASVRSGGGGHRDLTVRVKTARGRKTSSTRWLQRQLNDPYVQLAKSEGYRSRAAYKLIEMDDKHGFLAPNKRVLDLGAAPGGWTQIAVDRMGLMADSPNPVIAVDILEMQPMAGAHVIQLDFMADEAPDIILDALGGQKMDVVMSDIAPNTTGHAATDHVRIIALCELVYDFAVQVLAPEGVFICKVRQGGTEATLLKQMRLDFKKVTHMKPNSSRKESAESYVVAQGFRR